MGKLSLEVWRSVKGQGWVGEIKPELPIGSELNLPDFEHPMIVVEYVGLECCGARIAFLREKGSQRSIWTGIGCGGENPCGSKDTYTFEVHMPGEGA